MQPFGEYPWVLGLETVLCLAILQPATATWNREPWITLFDYFFKKKFYNSIHYSTNSPWTPIKLQALGIQRKADDMPHVLHNLCEDHEYQQGLSS